MSGGGNETRVKPETLVQPLTSSTECDAGEEPSSSPHPSPAPRRCRVAARPLPLAGSPTQTSAGGGYADPARRRDRATAAVHDYVEVLLESQLRRLQEPYEPDPHMCSVVSYPQRCNLWGDSGFHGNCDGSLFKELVLRYRPLKVADPMMGSGTTRDVIAGLNRRGFDIEYWGADLSTGFNAITTALPELFDFVWVHPPYWHIVRYSESPADLCNCVSYREYRAALRASLRNCFESLVPGGHLAVLVGDVRRCGRYLPIVRDVMNWEGELGELVSIIIKAQHNCRSDIKRYAQMDDVRIQHEYCVVFQRCITEPFDDCDVSWTPEGEGKR